MILATFLDWPMIIKKLDFFKDVITIQILWLYVQLPL